jgi:hypothetical protein
MYKCGTPSEQVRTACHAYSPAGELRDPASAPSRLRPCGAAHTRASPLRRSTNTKNSRFFGARKNEKRNMNLVALRTRLPRLLV